jgi:serine/threonine protein kinase
LQVNPSVREFKMRLLTKAEDLKIVGGYQLLETIGKGGMGVVYRARKQDSDDDPVALKLLLPDKGSAVLLKRFEQEFRAALRVDHPNIVKVLDFGVDGEHHFLVMELVEGKSLGSVIQKFGALKEEKVIDVMVQIAKGLHKIHQLNLVHRDVKPDNILLAASGVAKLTDLGLVKILDEDIDLTRPNSGLGTPNFMAPEQFNNSKHADPRYDIYSLGATLYTAITGKVPFWAATPLQVLKKKHCCELVPVRSLAPKVSAQIEQTIARAMSVDPRKRHASCEEFIAELTGKTAARSRRSSGTVRVVRTPAREFPGQEKRVYPRHPAHLDSRCLPVAGHKEDVWVSSICDVSLTGIGLLVNRRFEVGTVLEIKFQNLGEEAPLRLFVRVMRQQARAARKWLLGCKFASPLSDEELKALL